MSANNESAVLFLIELRSRLISSLLVLLVVFAVLLYFANPLYTLLANPLLKFLPGGHLIATQIVSPFFVPFKLALLAAMLVCVPYFLYQLWSFIKPALYRNEKRYVWPFLIFSGILFYSGMAFAYFVIFPLLFQFLANTAPAGVVLSPDIGEYLDFTMKLLLIFGSLFEIPMIMVLMVAINIVERAWFVRMRRYAIVAAFVIGMLLAPPDVMSQTILAVPIYLLYEAGIQLTRLVAGKKHHEETECESR